MANFKKEYLLREKEEKELKENEVIIKFTYGNTHEIVKNPGLNRTEKHLRKHRWRVYVEPFKKRYDINMLIDKVRFELHETFTRKVKICQKSPFSYKCVGWGSFMLPIDIHFKKWVGLGKITIDHDLVFKNKGVRQLYKLRVNKNYVPADFFKLKKK